ncbi:hypothetical protein AB6O49_33145 [Streptomyces sp. SBR177]
MRLPGEAEPVELRADPVAPVAALDGADGHELVEQPVRGALRHPAGQRELGDARRVVAVPP